ncbi:TatD family hydrolase [Alteromonas gilva]|uniref:TatD family hydrolase n=1 Tax=Alteromonas gilva TaxID=2987522 RepID=A0ABT5L6R4_9ALTE|nr:TatD family hydrolase [Alteromonas gilva]MDC8832758.1 TatD family hydrolase [Alteromonas gilva]
MIDSHCHLDLPAFAKDWQAVVAESQGCGVRRILIPGTTPAGWQQQRRMANQCAVLDIAFGLHPYFFPQNSDTALSELGDALATSDSANRLVALGEIGIDASIDTPLDTQQALFEEQLKLAAQYNLPVILHHRRSHHLLIESIKRCQFSGGGVVHAFSGSEQVAQSYIDMGFKLGVGGTITYERARKTRKALANTDICHLLLETDAPDMPLAGRQGQRNSPVYLPEVAAALASLHNTSVADVSAHTDANYDSLFGRLDHCK